MPRPTRLFEVHSVREVDGRRIPFSPGLVAHGVEFDDGGVIIRHVGDTGPCAPVWPSLDCAMQIWGWGGLARVVWEPPVPPGKPRVRR